MRISVITLWVFVFALSRAMAQYTLEIQEDTTFLLYRLEEVVVYGNRYVRSPSLITEIPAIEIRARNGGTVADILRRDPGLTVTSGPKAETETRIRGFKASDVLVLVDGRPINPGYYGKADLSMLPKDHIARIKIIKGPGSVAFGSNAMGGVINIITKNGFDAPRFRVDTEFGTHEFRRLSMNHSRRFGKFHTWISGYEHHANGFQLSRNFKTTPLEDGGLRSNSDYHKVGMIGKLGFRPSDRVDYSLSVGYHWAKKGCVPTVSLLEQPRFRKFPKWKRYGAALSGRWQLKPGMELKSILFVDGYHDRLKSYLTGTFSDDQLDYDSVLENWTLGGSAETRAEIGDSHKMQWGVHFRRDLMNKKPDADEPWVSHFHYTGSGFIEDRYSPWKRTTLTLGLGYHVFDTESKDGWTTYWSPMMSLNQALPYQVYVHASWANAIRFPTMHQLYGESSGNEDLKPESADKMEIGLERFLFLDFRKVGTAGWKWYISIMP